MDSGFTSLRSFNRNFSLYIGMTPTEYRENQTVFGRS
jgi:AraC-like DNA-binding protein